MTKEEFKNIFVNYDNSKAFKLLERVFDELIKRGIEPCIVEYHCGSKKPKENESYINLETIYKHNATAENTTCRIDVYNKLRIATVKIPGGASDKVINNRINKILESI